MVKVSKLSRFVLHSTVRLHNSIVSQNDEFLLQICSPSNYNFSDLYLPCELVSEYDFGSEHVSRLHGRPS